eukprot:TRINITY_DN3454_c0_g1_i4.p1 TRINITY_DN3454_c0_g1~~TRINITY_DN3454_c0_g1_i4.p1  ORF type:complete len:305 (+),score=65.05 TRINITY_DN3454_c0_g1_i4:84-917(+)
MLRALGRLISRGEFGRYSTSSSPRLLVCVPSSLSAVAARDSLSKNFFQPPLLAHELRSQYSTQSQDSRVKIYTKTGDKGTSSLFTGERRKKNDVVFDALGAVDELSAHLGLAREYCDRSNNQLSDKLIEIQSRLLDVGSNIATPRDSATEAQKAFTNFDDNNVTTLEAWIDEMEAQLPPLTTFILPSGGESACNLHVARAVCRRAERLVAPLFDSGGVDESVFKYLNRLSDFLFVAARLASQHEKQDAYLYKRPPRESRDPANKYQRTIHVESATKS